jgi:hypothetical protein
MVITFGFGGGCWDGPPGLLLPPHAQRVSATNAGAKRLHAITNRLIIAG